MTDESQLAQDLAERAIAAKNTESLDEFLDRECQGNARLRAQVDAILRNHLLEERAKTPDGSDLLTTMDLPSDYVQGKVIAGRYTLQRVLGEGGMGIVWSAMQTEPVSRHVALKLIKAGMDSRQVLARFNAERQALALMDHPNIAKVYDGGVTEQGRPFFVMEYVRGVPLTRYCDEARLSLSERLELFSAVCSAVQHAHQKGIIHRDLKPSNILIHLQDGRAEPKVIDFGLAKATSQALTIQSLFTARGVMVGTPVYMSPEQADGGDLDVDTRTDIYSLGVILYELLTGITPLEQHQVREAAYREVLRLIKEEEPLRPSIRLSGSDMLPSVAAQRRIQPDELRRSLAGDLDWIVMKSLEKNRSRRYESASELAEDIRRHLSAEPVLAAPPNTIYRAKKFVRRHRGAVIAAAFIAVALMLGIIGTSLGLAWAIRERNDAEIARGDAVKSADNLKRVSEFQAEMLAQINPTEAGQWLTERVNNQISAALSTDGVQDSERSTRLHDFQEQWDRINATDTARQFIDHTILRPAAETIGSRFQDQPLVDAQLCQVLADRYRELGMYEASAPLQQRALATRRRELGNQHLDTLTSIANMGILLRMRGKLAEAEPYYREVLDSRRRILGDDDVDTIDAIGNMGVILNEQLRHGEAEPFYREALERSEQALGPAHEYTLVSSSNLAFWLQEDGKPEEAEKLYRTALKEARSSLGEDNQHTLHIMHSLGYLLQSQGRLDEALDNYLEALEKRRTLQGEKHPDTLDSLHNLAFFYDQQGDLTKAVELYRDVITKREEVLGEYHQDTLLSMHNLAFLLQDQQDLEAESVCRETLRRRQASLGVVHPHTYDSVSILGSILTDQRKYTEAEAHYRLWLGRFQQLLGESEFDSLYLMHDLVATLFDQGKFPEAEALCRKERDLWNGKFGDKDIDTLKATQTLSAILCASGKLSEAEAMAADAARTSRESLGLEDPVTLNTIRVLGSVHISQGEYAEAIALLTPALEPAQRQFAGRSRYQLGLLLMELGRAQIGAGDYLSAETHLLEAVNILDETRGREHRETRICSQELAELYEAWHISEPQAGHDASAQTWRDRL